MELRNLQIDSFDPGAMDETVKGASLSHVLMAPGRFRAQLLSARAGDQRLDYGSYNLPVHARGGMPESHITLGFVLANRETTSLNGFRLDGPALMVLREGASLDYRLAPGTEWLGFQVTADSLERLGIDPSKLPATPISHYAPQCGRLCGELKAAVAALQALESDRPMIVAPENFGNKLFASVMDGFHAALQGGNSAGSTVPRYRPADYRLLSQVTAYIDANMAQPLQIGAICSEFRTDWRALERAFARLLGVTPKRYLQLARLARARRLLVQSSQSALTISEIAHRCGIDHLSRFSQAYKKLYGELPSATLRR